MTEGLTGAYDKRDFSAGPSTYSDDEFITKIIGALGLDSTSTGRLLDLMSGPGKLATAIHKRVPGLKITLLDRAEKQLDAADPGFAKVIADAIPQSDTHPTLPNASFDLAVARYAMKDIPRNHQDAVARAVFRSLKPGGTFVIADMTAPSSLVRDWLNEQHSLKQQFGGRDISTEGSCFIPTTLGWRSLLARAGFKTKHYADHMSHVATSKWVSGNQINAEQLRLLNEFILSAPIGVRREFHIRCEGDDVMIDYPLAIVQGKKL